MSVASIKYYVREGLLAPGDPTRPHRAYYDERHLRRLAILRAMRDADISIDAMQRALAAVDAPRTDAVDAIAPAIDALAPRRATSVDAHLRAARRQVSKVFSDRKLLVRAHAGSRETIAQALAALARVGAPVAVTAIDAYLDALAPVARAEIEHPETRTMLLSDKEGSLEIAVLGSVLYEPIVVALRRALHEHYTTKLVRRRKGGRR